MRAVKIKPIVPMGYPAFALAANLYGAGKNKMSAQGCTANNNLESLPAEKSRQGCRNRAKIMYLFRARAGRCRSNRADITFFELPAHL